MLDNDCMWDLLSRWVITTKQEDDMKTYVEPEENAYPHGGQTRKFVAYLSMYLAGSGRIPGRYVDSEYLVSGKGGIPDTFFSIPGYAIVKGKYVPGYLTVREDGEYLFNVRK